MTLRVAHVIATLAPRDGGPPRAVQDMCRVLAERGHHVELLTTNQDGSGVLPVIVGQPVATDGYETTYYPAGRPRTYPITRGLVKALLERTPSYDVVEVHGLYLFHSLAAGVIARRRHVPYVIQPHGSLDRYQRAHHRGRKALYGIIAERRNLDFASAIHYTTAHEQREAEETGISAPGCVVPLGVDTDLYGRPPVETRLPDGVPTGVPLITFMGRLATVKGLPVLLDAFGLVARTHDTAHLVIAGPDNHGLRAVLDHQAAEAGISGRVTFTGMIAGPEKVALLQKSWVFVLPSEHESFGIAAVEAMAARVPVIVSRGVGIHVEVEAGGAGLVVEHAGGAIASGILRLLSDAAIREDMAAAAQDLALQRFSLEAMARGLEAMYQVAMCRSGSDPSGGRG